MSSKGAEDLHPGEVDTTSPQPREAAAAHQSSTTEQGNKVCPFHLTEEALQEANPSWAPSRGPSACPGPLWWPWGEASSTEVSLPSWASDPARPGLPCPAQPHCAPEGGFGLREPNRPQRAPGEAQPQPHDSSYRHHPQGKLREGPRAAQRDRAGGRTKSTDRWGRRQRRSCAQPR